MHLPRRLASSVAHLHDSHSWAIVPRTDRAAIAVRGRDALSFLQNLTTNDTRLLRNPDDAEHTCFLNQKGRSIFEAALALSSTSKPEEPHLLVETAAEQAPDLLAHLKRSRVRAKVELLDLTSSYSITSVVSTDPFALSTSDAPHKKRRDEVLGLLRHVAAAAPAATSSSSAATTPSSPSPTSPVSPQPFSGSAAFLDPRNPLMGLRVIAPSSLDLELSLEGFKRAPLHHLQALRVLLGIPEGKEVVDVIPLEWNLPYLNAVSFAKGCYLGQELIARGHFRGLIRKRFVPVYFSPGGAPARPVACANAVAATLVRQTDDAMLRRTHGQAPGGQGHGKGHGPSQKHDFPASQAKGHYVPHSRIHGETANAPSASSIPGPTSPASTTHRIRLPFPFVDLEWRGRVEVGTALSVVEGAGAKDKDKHKDGDGGAGGGSGGGVGERVGKIVSWIPGTNLGLVNLRLDHINHTFPQAQPPHKTSRNGAPVVDEPPSPITNEATKQEGGSDEDGDDSSEARMKEAESALRYGDDDFSDERVSRELLALQERCKSRAVNFKVPAAVEATKAAGDANVTGKGQHGVTGENYHVTPVLPSFFRHIPHSGVEEVVVGGSKA